MRLVPVKLVIDWAVMLLVAITGRRSSNLCIEMDPCPCEVDPGVSHATTKGQRCFEWHIAQEKTEKEPKQHKAVGIEIQVAPRWQLFKRILEQPTRPKQTQPDQREWLDNVPKNACDLHELR